MTQTRNERRRRESEEAERKVRAMEQQSGAAAPRPGFLRGGDDSEDLPPLDWRLTPRNVALQLLAIVIFAGAVWLLASLFFEGMWAVFDR